ncbi:hypothetical protein PLESTB_001072300 [Pleodorina starrii]|uniref:C-CAP/cofactor C-like domain-containing protein n=1 Tax=Pleodorina starrii TaxID=330485 RepID=A0A9W6BQA6_9CHLO|nr:hypothetical protein PLESTB_001072300 [Pleodorina starrii]GLC74984.1 hypothetical protein PLESTF_001579700 [Pleodorina starrii]
MDANDYIFRKRTGERLVKAPGSINGNGFVLDTLHDCEVYLLDHTSQVQIDDCTNCKIFIGPTDGSVFLRDCSDCTLCVAARQLRTRDCKDLDIALYCATQPSIETSTGIVFSCWRGAYPGLTEHFKRARLDPTKNTWKQVYDFNRAEDLGAEHFRLDESVRPWWTTAPEGQDGAATSPPDCPVPAADGSLFGGGHLAPLEEQSPPKPPPGAPTLPASLPPSPGRAAAYDEEVELEDDEDEPVTILPPGAEDGGRSLVAPAQPSPRGETRLRALQPDNPASALDSPGIASAGASASAGAGGPVLGRSTGDGGGAGAGFPRSDGNGDGGDGNPFGALTEPQALAAAAVAVDDDPFFTAVEQPPPPPPPADAAGAAAAGAAAAGAAGPPLQVAQDHAGAADARVAWRLANSRELSQRTAQEGQAKAAVQEEAGRKLEGLQQTRAARLKQRFATNRAASEKPAAAAAVAGAGGTAGWERVAELVDLTAAGGGGGGGKVVRPAAAPCKDVTRLRQLIISLKAKRK